ncbi:MAG: hypothetical protein A2568_00080 [Candidatus Yanofskybacteria bacterium RIFOXYD1_FULL_44_17]|uniref:3D domain-containing protein n=1 Tax=Candidatus Yanofskybacteria bacterium GW2011_GWE2_40_11 TaxID=1619033 RepID=A0A0G0T0J7_9BACT|nr:MAG: hypothetical protein UT69_C0023G0004 [Candidatus Yanofskybacteria bacterium GW2011_GWE1_40_10]KKR40625.1 MAG: hypothetical protein UT75_C0006G0004 [Candidatus Yanofskybacteria bacterium GW2011_GWE2_40_11]OGN37029.1 MAG: hypothetical protein A2241_03635 [Candidatus Yanofskybacteria bacterium RIFOXYA2_FULL_45_28]OGN37036.1 MAG: hypothetical protein A2302_00030 [Candidatus Yanofskybacteria bacterium RIFOXYB2_FULL_44_18]OGN37251.1 MAG: hypothetical protein A2371_02690 [Candidatus Yanofskyba
MNTKIIALIVLLVIVIQTSATSQASVADWFSSKNAKAVAIESGWSFDSIYNNVQTTAKDKDAQISQNSSIVPLSSQAAIGKSSPKIANRTFVVDATAYSSTVDQTDDTPFITASGTFVRDGVVATNFLPIGTRIKIPDLYGDKQFIVEDRMNSRYWYRVDVWFPNRESAMKFGLKKIKIEVISN